MGKEAKSVKIENMSLMWFESTRGNGGKEESPPIGEKKILLFRAEEGRDINTKTKI